VVTIFCDFEVLANRKIISAPIMRMERPRHPNPHLMTGVPEKWAQAAKYCSKMPGIRARPKSKLLLSADAGSMARAEHPAITAPEEWDRNLAVQCPDNDYEHAVR